MIDQELRDRIAAENPSAILWDDLDEAIVGFAYRCGQPTLVVYDYAWMVEAFASRHKEDGDTVDDEEAYVRATEWVDFNIVGAWVGENTPLTLYRREPAESSDENPDSV